MGGLVGGVYATGRNATELRDVVNGINWDQAMAEIHPSMTIISPEGRCPRLSQ